MKALLLYNPKSGHARIGKHLDDIIEIFRKAQIDIRAKRIEFSKNPLADESDVELVVICGGDGTINFVVNNMRKLNINPLIGIIPAGTANDFAGALGMSRNILRAARQIAYGSERKVDCGLVNNTHFVNVLSFGVLTTTSQKTSDKAKHRYGSRPRIERSVLWASWPTCVLVSRICTASTAYRYTSRATTRSSM